MPKIKIYSTATCVYCRAEKAFFAEHNIPFDEAHADQDAKIAEELFQVSGQLGVPFTIITKEDGTTEKILGFDQSRLSAVLGI